MCKDLLKRSNTAATNLRAATIKALTIAHKSLTPAEILDKIRKTKSVNKVTLYRILALLEEKNIIRKILTSDNISHYELIDPLAKGAQSLPPHFACRVCKKIFPLNSPEVENIVAEKLGKIFSGPIEITIAGICLACKKRKK
jgi:Fur family ferric uptake transcriptional regulator